MALISVDRAGVGCTRPWQMMPFEAWSDCKLGCVGLCAGLECGLSGAGTAYDIDRDRVWRWRLALSCHRVLLQRFAGDCVVGVGNVPFSKGRGR